MLRAPIQVSDDAARRWADLHRPRHLPSDAPDEIRQAMRLTGRTMASSADDAGDLRYMAVESSTVDAVVVYRREADGVRVVRVLDPSD